MLTTIITFVLIAVLFVAVIVLSLQNKRLRALIDLNSDCIDISAKIREINHEICMNNFKLIENVLDKQDEINTSYVTYNASVKDLLEIHHKELTKHHLILTNLAYNKA